MTVTTDGVIQLHRSVARAEVVRIDTLAPLLGVAGAAFGWVGSWIPSPSVDEAATASAVDRSLPELIGMAAAHVDAVHGLYYVIAHVWIQVFGLSDTGLRLLSAIGVGVGVAGTTALAQLIGTRTFAAGSGLACATMPLTMWTATEARSFAWVVAAAAWIGYTAVLATHRGGRVWIAYTALVTVGVLLFVYLALVVVALVTAVWSTRRLRPHAARITLASAVASVVTAPLVVAAVSQRSQVGWIGPVTPSMLQSAAMQWFDAANPPYTVLLWALTLIGIGRSLVHKRRTESLWSVVLLLPWLVVPTGVLLLLTAAGMPSYVPRYAAVSVPAAAMFVAAGLTTFRRLVVPLVVLMCVLSVPTWMAQRTPLANGTDWRATAANVAQLKRPGDALYFGQTGALQQPRLMRRMYRSEFSGMSDIALGAPAAELGGLFDWLRPAKEVLARRPLPDRVIVVADNVAPWWHSTEDQTFTAAGYKVQQSRIGAITTVVVLRRR